MAKGQSTFQQLGRIDGRKYYRVKGVQGIVSQHINEKMSDRVKNGAEYANTRLNNAEFGGAGSTAGAITRALSQKWRYLLVPFATGKLAKEVRSFMSLDSTGKWGQRGLTGTGWQTPLAEQISLLSKNKVADYSGLKVLCQFSSENGLSVTTEISDELHNEKLEALGCDGVKVIFLGGVLTASTFDAATGKYAPAINDIQVIGEASYDFGGSDEESAFRGDIKVTAQVANKMYAGGVVMLPIKTINGTSYIMQEHCSFKMIAAV